MRKLLTVASLSMLVMIGAAGPAAAETRTYVYDLAFQDVVWDVCFDMRTVDQTTGVPLAEEAVCGTNGGHLNIGGVQAVVTPAVYNNAVITAQDEIGSQPFLIGAYSENGPEQGGFTNPAFDEGCRPLFSPERESDYLNVFVNIIGTTDELDVCIGSRGTVTIDYF